MTRFRFVAIALVVTLLAVYATSLALAHGGDLEKIHSCLDKKGNVRIIAAQAVCDKDETPLDWNIAGLAGTAGATGASGAAGAKGDKGDTGSSAAASFPGERAIGFAHINGVTGDSQAAGHVGDVVITGFKAGATLAVSHTGGGGGTIGRPDFADFVITKAIDKASPQLFELLATGRHIIDARMQITMPDSGGQAVTFEYRFRDLLVTAVTTSSSGRIGESPLEQVSFNFSEITVAYRVGANVTDTCFDLDRGRSC